MDDNLIIKLLKKLNPETKVVKNDLSSKKKLKEISSRVGKNLRKTNQNLNTYAEIIKEILIKNNPDKRDFIMLVNNGLNSSSQKINDTYNNVHELKLILNNLSHYIRDDLRDDLNRINSGIEITSELVRNTIWEGPKFNNTSLSLGDKLRDILDNITHSFRSDSLNTSLEQNRKRVLDSQTQLENESRRSELEVKRLEKVIYDLRKELEKLEYKYKSNDDKKVEAERLEIKLSGIVSDLENKFSLVNKQKSELNSKINEFGQSNSVLEQEKNRLNDSLLKLDTELELSRNQISELKQYKNKIDQQNTELSNKYDSIISQKRQLSDEMSITNKDQLKNINTLEQTIKTLNAQLGSLTQDHSSLEKERNSLLQLSERNTFEDLKKLLIKLKRSSKINDDESNILAKILWSENKQVREMMTSKPLTRVRQPSSASSLRRSTSTPTTVMPQYTSSQMSATPVIPQYTSSQMTATPVMPQYTSSQMTAPQVGQQLTPVMPQYTSSQMTAPPQKKSSQVSEIMTVTPQKKSSQVSEIMTATPISQLSTPKMPQSAYNQQNSNNISDKEKKKKALELNKKQYEQKYKKLENKTEILINKGQYNQAGDMKETFDLLNLQLKTKNQNIQNMNSDELDEYIENNTQKKQQPDNNSKLTGLPKILADKERRRADKERRRAAKERRRAESK